MFVMLRLTGKELFLGILRIHGELINEGSLSVLYNMVRILLPDIVKKNYAKNAKEVFNFI